MIQGDPEFEMIDSEIDKWRFICFIVLELQAKKPIPADEEYLAKKGFDFKKRKLSLTLQLLQNFISVVTEDLKVCVLDKDVEVYTAVDKEENREEKHVYGEFKHVLLTDKDMTKLNEKFGEQGTLDRIANLDRAIEQKGYKYKNFYLTILEWEKRNGKSGQHSGFKRGDNTAGTVDSQKLRDAGIPE
jgi:hypothetical protein